MRLKILVISLEFQVNGSVFLSSPSILFSKISMCGISVCRVVIKKYYKKTKLI